LHGNRLIPRFDIELQSNCIVSFGPPISLYRIKMTVQWLRNFLTAHTNLKTPLHELPHNLQYAIHIADSTN